MATTACVDASLVVRQVTSPDDAEVHELWDRWAAGDARLIAPSLLWFEVTNVIYRMQRLAFLTPPAARAALTAAAALPVRAVGGPDLHRSAYDVALRFDLKAAYDAHYVAVAEGAGAQVWTVDERLCRTLGEAGAHLVRLVRPAA